MSLTPLSSHHTSIRKSCCLLSKYTLLKQKTDKSSRPPFHAEKSENLYSDLPGPVFSPPSLSKLLPTLILFALSVPGTLVPCWSSNSWACTPAAGVAQPTLLSQSHQEDLSYCTMFQPVYPMACLNEMIAVSLPENFDSLDLASLLPLVGKSHWTVKPTQIPSSWEL